MSLGPTTVPTIFDLVGAHGGLTGTATGNGASVILPPGKKAIQVSLITSSTLTLKVQNSLDNANWFDISSSTVSTVNTAGGSFISEVDSTVPYWRAAITAFTVAGTGTGSQAIPVARIAQLII